mmetsp:Transcript_33292/g.50216  ORF Transcript_33292/g.50216 Transcript_33292/m.50216 type:complete len:802 (+) Transcript_33292:120-2525(+)
MGNQGSSEGSPPKKTGKSRGKNRASVVDEADVVVARGKGSSDDKNNKRENPKFRNIFATPLDETSKYTVPSYNKSNEQTEFIKNAILQNFVFSNLDESEIKTMVGAFKQVTFKKDELIIKEGEEGDYYYVIDSGEVQFSVQGRVVGAPAGRGDTFGELALLYSAPRAATCKALSEETVLFSVNQETFRYTLQHKTQAADTMKRNLIKDLKLFEGLEEKDLNKLAENMIPRTFSKGEVVFRKDDVGDRFYVLQEGSVDLTEVSAGGTKYDDVQLKSGDFFGERALILKEPRAATCTAATGVIALSVDSDTFKNVMGNLGTLVMRKTDKRTLLGIELFKRTHLDENDVAALSNCIGDEKFRSNSTIFNEGSKIPAALYLVRKGKVELTKRNDDNFSQTIGPGGYFGEDMLKLDIKGKDANASCSAKFTAKTLAEDVVVGKLTLLDCRTVIDTTHIGSKPRPEKKASVMEEMIDISKLKRHRILGAGTFGQVWLVSREGSGGDKKPYALKIQSKYELTSAKQAKGVVQERSVMAKLKHPFIIRLVSTSQDKQMVYMLLQLVQGGEMYSIIHRDNGSGIPIKDTIFYSACILEGLGHMHRRQILYRDLKPENVLIGADGYPVIVDLGFAKVVKDKTYTLCGTPLYLAPEVITNRGHDQGADHWSLGVMIFEMLSGDTPFYEEGMDQIGLMKSIVKKKLKYPTSRAKRAHFFKDDSKEIISALLTKSPAARLGSLAGGEKDIYEASFFRSIQFGNLKAKKLIPPMKPDIKNPLDTSYFENWDHLDDKTQMIEPPISKKENAVFKDF